METFGLEQLAYFAEVVGVIAIVASLIYVGKQLRQNTETMRFSAAHDHIQLMDNLASRVFCDRDVAELWTKGRCEFETLDEVDQQRLLVHEVTGLNMWYYLYNMREANIMPDSQWQQISWTFSYFGGRQSVRRAWESQKEGFSVEYQELMSPHLEHASEA